MRKALALGLLVLAACGGSTPAAEAPQNAPATAEEPPRWEGAASPSEKANEPQKVSGAPLPKTPEARREDRYDKANTDIELKRAGRLVKANCGSATDSEGKPTGPWGKVTLSLTLGANGHMRGVGVPAPFTDTPPGRCIAQAFNNLHFPPWSGADTTIDWEVDVEKPAAPEKGKKK